MHTLTRLLRQFWGVLMYATLGPSRALRQKSVDLQLTGLAGGAAVPPCRSLCDLPRSLQARRTRWAVPGAKPSDPPDIAFCAWMYYLN